jgi:hypothetical protein
MSVLKMTNKMKKVTYYCYMHALCCNKNITSQNCDTKKENISRRVLLHMHLASYPIFSHSHMLVDMCHHAGGLGAMQGVQ